MRKLLFLALILSGLTAHAENVFTAQVTVANLPSAASASGFVFIVKDGLTATDCTVGGGTNPPYVVFCKSNGSVWASGPVGPGLAAWSSGTTYGSGDVAVYMGALYISIAAGNLNHLPTLTMYWTAVGNGCGSENCALVPNIDNGIRYVTGTPFGSDTSSSPTDPGQPFLTLYDTFANLANLYSSVGGNLISPATVHILSRLNGGVLTAPDALDSGLQLIGGGDLNSFTATALSISGATVSFTVSGTFPTRNAYWQAGNGATLSIFASSNATFNGNCLIVSISGSSGTCTEQSPMAASGTATSAVIVPYKWVPVGSGGFKMDCQGSNQANGQCSVQANIFAAGGPESTITSISEDGGTPGLVTVVYTAAFPSLYMQGQPAFITAVPTGATACTSMVGGYCGGYNGYFIINSNSFMGTSGTFTYYDAVTGLSAGSTGNSAPESPGIWLAGIGGSTIEGIRLTGSTLPYLSADSNMACVQPFTMACDSGNNQSLINSAIVVYPESPMAGPPCWFTSGLILGNVMDVDCSVNSGAPSLTDQRAAVLIANSGGVNITRLHSGGGGGIRIYGGGSGSFESINGYIQEGAGYTQPAIEAMGGAGCAQLTISVYGTIDSGGGDAFNTPYAIENHGCAEIFDYTDTRFGGNHGPNIHIANGFVLSDRPAAEGQSGTGNGNIFGLQTNASRINGVPVVTRFTNLITTPVTPSIGNWPSFSGTGVSVTAVTDPFYGSTAGSIGCTVNDGDGECQVAPYNNTSLALVTGEYVITSGWVKPGGQGLPNLIYSSPLNVKLGRNLAASSFGYAESNGKGATNTMYAALGYQHFWWWGRLDQTGDNFTNGGDGLQATLRASVAGPQVFWDPQVFLVPATQMPYLPAATTSCVSGGALAAAVYLVRTTYTSAIGEGAAQSVDAVQSCASSTLLQVASPSSYSGATGWNVYIGPQNLTSSTGCGQPGVETGFGAFCLAKQNSTPTAIASAWTESTGGLVVPMSVSNYGALGPAGQGTPQNDASNSYGDDFIADLAVSIGDQCSTCSVGQYGTPFGPTYGGLFSTLTTAYTLKVSDGWVNVTGTTTIKAPHLVAGQLWTVFNSGSDTVTLEADSGNFNGTTSVSLATNTGMSVTCDGTNCFGH